MLATAVVGSIADGARVLVGAAASLGTSGTVVVPVASFVAVATLRRPLQTRTTLGSAFRRSERLRAPMGPISGGIGSLGDGVPERIAGDKKKFTPAVITAKF